VDQLAGDESCQFGAYVPALPSRPNEDVAGVAVSQQCQEQFPKSHPDSRNRFGFGRQPAPYHVEQQRTCTKENHNER
jgi:hypothetical protein